MWALIVQNFAVCIYNNLAVRPVTDYEKFWQKKKKTDLKDTFVLQISGTEF